MQDLVGGSESRAYRIRASSGYTPLQLEKLDGRPFCIEGAWQAAPGNKPALLCSVVILSSAWALCQHNAVTDLL